MEIGKRGLVQVFLSSGERGRSLREAPKDTPDPHGTGNGVASEAQEQSSGPAGE